MSIDIPPGDRIEMSQRERDRLKVLHTVLEGQRTQAEAARILRLTTRQVRRLLRRLASGGDAALIHGLRGRPSNRRFDPKFRQPPGGLPPALPRLRPHPRQRETRRVGPGRLPHTLRRWLLAEGLWQRQRRRDGHRSRRPRRTCFGELVQIDTSIHEWTEGRGEDMVLIHMIDDATSRLLARFYPADTTEAHLDLLGRWLRRTAAPWPCTPTGTASSSPRTRGRPCPAPRRSSAGLAELGIDLIRAHSPQAKGRVERSFGTAQDRWVKEMRLAKVTTSPGPTSCWRATCCRSTATVHGGAASAGDAHRALGKATTWRRS